MEDALIIGKGRYGLVYRVERLSTAGEPTVFVAAKRINIKKANARAILELSILSTYVHPLLNRALDIEIDTEYITIYQDLADCDLKQYLKKQLPIPSLAKSWLYDLSSALVFLHQERIIHGDIKPHNILVYGTSLKLNDFGGSIIVDGTSTTGISGTIKYYAPETLLYNTLSFKTDIWSLGCVAYEILTGVALITYVDNHSEQSYRHRTAKSIQLWREEEGDLIKDKLEPLCCLPVAFSVSGLAGELIKSLTHYNDYNRPTAEGIIEHAWFGGLKRQYQVQVICNYLEPKRHQRSRGEVVDYLAFRELKVVSHVLEKAVAILAGSPWGSGSGSGCDVTPWVEASLLIASKMYLYHIPHFHPITPSPQLKETELALVTESHYRLHKCACRELYVNLGNP